MGLYRGVQGLAAREVVASWERSNKFFQPRPWIPPHFLEARHAQAVPSLVMLKSFLFRRDLPII